MRIARKIDAVVRTVLATLLAALVLCVTWQIVSRYVLGDPSPWTEELARYLLIWVGLLGGAYAYHTGMHLGLDLLAGKLDDGFRKIQRVVVHVCVLVFAVTALLGGGLELVRLTLELAQYSPALGIPMAVVYSGIPLSGLLFVYYSLIAIATGADPMAAQSEES